MLNNDNDLRPAYAFAYVTEPQDIKEEEEVNLSPTVFKWFWVAASVASWFVADRVKKDAERKAKREVESATNEAKAAQQNYIDAQKVAAAEQSQQESAMAAQKEAQEAEQVAADEALAKSQADTLAAQQQARADIGEATRQSQLSMASAESQAEQQLALQTAEADRTSVGQPGVSYTPVKQTSSLGIGGTQEPEEGVEATSGLTI